jgi:hypothetical protein
MVVLGHECITQIPNEKFDREMEFTCGILDTGTMCMETEALLHSEVSKAYQKDSFNSVQQFIRVRLNMIQTHSSPINYHDTQACGNDIPTRAWLHGDG